MTRTDLAKQVYLAHGGLTFAEARVLVDGVLDLMTEGLVAEGRLVVSGFGTFKVVERKARTGRDLGKGKPVQIPSHRTVVFVPSKQRFGGGPQ